MKNTKGTVVWIHASSLGEFEQGRPVIEKLKEEKPDISILLTFFSPSGYEIRKNYEYADWVYCLPLDTPSHASQFVQIVDPVLVIFIKYEFWFHYLKELQQKHVPVLIVSAVFRKNQMFFNWKGRFFKPVLRGIRHYFVQDETSERLIRAFTDNVTVTGDTRFDRVIDIASEAQHFKVVDQFTGNHKVMVLGSTWPGDMKVMIPFMCKYASKLKFIIAPHNIKEEEILTIESALEHTTRYSVSKSPDEARVLIIDNIGMLSSLYRYGEYAYVGGGFRGALHNTLEAIVYGIPVFIGAHENNQKFAEAVALEKLGVAFSCATFGELDKAFNALFQDQENYKRTAELAGNFVRSRSGATARAMEKIRQLV